MKSKFRTFLPVVVASWLAIAATAQNQTSGHSLGVSSPPFFTSLGLGYGPAGTILSATKNAPFSAEVSEQVDQTLNDGTTIHHETQEIVMRDGAGRIYRARALSRMPDKQKNGFQMITIIDTPRHLQFVCSSFRKVCTQMTYHIPPSFRRPNLSNLEKHPGISIEDLGPSEISGQSVVGMRVIRTLPEGAMGNDRPITTTEESWYSKALDVNVQFQRNDPRMGVHTTTMTSVNPGEPDPTYFQIPEGYKVEERTFPNGLEPAAGGSGTVEVEGMKKQ